jgi:hypothetical protein
MNANTNPIALLVAELRQARASEKAATDLRQSLEAQLVSLHPVTDGSEETVKGDGYSIAFKMTRKVDSDALFAVFNTLPDNAKKAFRFKADLALTQYRALSEFDAATFNKVAAFVTTTPAKPTVTLKD